MNHDWKVVLCRELSNAALFDEGVEAARNACVAGASIASAVITAAAWYDNPLTGLPALRACMKRISTLRLDVSVWKSALVQEPHPETDDPMFTPGFGFVDTENARALLEACARVVAAHDPTTDCPRSAFFLDNHAAIESVSGSLNHAGLAAMQFVDHEIEAEEAERMFLLWRIDTAVSEAQHARARGVHAFPFFTDQYVYEGTWPEARTLDMTALLRELGID